MKKFRKGLTISFLVLLCISLVACSSNNNGGNATNNEPAGENNNNAVVDEGLPMSDGKYDPPVTLTTVKALKPSLEYREGETIDDNIYTRLIQEHVGIDLEFLWTNSVLEGAFDTKLMLSLSSGEDMPDIVNVTASIAHELIDSGKFRPIGDLFEQYANETWKEAASQAEVDWIPYQRDGERYGIPSFNYKYENDPVMWIRQDWLDQLDLEAPKTLSELEIVMDAFSNDDPDGNGEDDTIGIALAPEKPGLTVDPKGWVRHNWVFGAQGALPGQWEVDDNGKITYGSLNPNVKKGLATLNDWMEKGYLHPEYGLHDPTKAAELFNQGQAGIIMGSTWLWAWPLNAIAEVNPDSVLQSYPLPTGDDGSLMVHGLLNHHQVTLINKDMKNPEIYFTLQNFFYEEYANPKEGGIFEFGLAEGYDWATVDGKKVFTDAEIPGGQIMGYDYAIDPAIARIPELQFDIFAKLANGEEPVTPREKRIAETAGKNEQTLRTAEFAIEGEKYIVNNAYLGAPTEMMKQHSDFLIKMEEEVFSKIIYGDLPLSAFDDYVEDFMSTGGDEITTEVQAWYDSNK